MPIHLRLREFRHILGLTQAELAARAGVRRATLSRLETSRVTAIDLGVLEKLADVIGVEPGLLLSRTIPHPTPNLARDLIVRRRRRRRGLSGALAPEHD